MYTSNKVSKMTRTFKSGLEKLYKDGAIDSQLVTIDQYNYTDDSDRCGLRETMTFTTKQGTVYTADYLHNSGNPIALVIK